MDKMAQNERKQRNNINCFNNYDYSNGNIRGKEVNGVKVMYDVGYAVEKATDNVKDAVKDAAFDVEYAVKRDTGLYAKNEYDKAEYALRAAEDQLKKAKANHDQSAVYMAEFFLEQAEERYEKAQKAYEGTPMHSIESGLEWVSGLFKNKKRFGFIAPSQSKKLYDSGG